MTRRSWQGVCAVHGTEHFEHPEHLVGWRAIHKNCTDPVTRPSHYTSHPSGVEAIQITEHLNFCIGNAVKYLWRAGLKHDALEDLKKARWYVDREIDRIERGDHG